MPAVLLLHPMNSKECQYACLPSDMTINLMRLQKMMQQYLSQVTLPSLSLSLSPPPSLPSLSLSLPLSLSPPLSPSLPQKSHRGKMGGSHNSVWYSPTPRPSASSTWTAPCLRNRQGPAHRWGFPFHSAQRGTRCNQKPPVLHGPRRARLSL